MRIPYGVPVPLMTPVSVSLIAVVQQRMMDVTLAGNLTQFVVPDSSSTSGTSVLHILKVDLILPPAVANASVPLDQVVQYPPVLLRGGVFGFQDINLFTLKSAGNVSLVIERSVSAFGYIIVEFSTFDDVAISADGHYQQSHGFLQFAPFERSKVCCCRGACCSS